jgi:hypothetical protein
MPICGWPPSVSWSIALPMSCSSPRAGRGAVEAQLVGDRLRDVRHLQRVLQHVLPVAGADSQPAEHRDDRLGDVREVRLLHRLLADLQQLFLHLLADVAATTSSIRAGMNAAVLHELLERDARDLAAHGIEAAHDDTPGVSSMITSTPVAFSKLRMLRPSRPMTRPFMSSLGIVTC